MDDPEKRFRGEDNGLEKPLTAPDDTTPHHSEADHPEEVEGGDEDQIEGGGFYRGAGLDDEQASAETSASQSGSAQTPNPTQLGKAEGAAEKFGGGSAGEAAGTGEKNLFKDNPLTSGGLQGLVKRFATKKNSMIGSGIGAVLAASVFLGSMASGPFQLIHIGQVLGHAFSKNDSDSSERSNSLLRYYKAYKNKNIAQTRVGFLGEKVVGKLLDRLEKVGFTVETNSAKRPTAIAIDRALVEKRFPQTKGMTDEKFKSFVGDALGRPAAEITSTTTDGKTSFKLDVRGLSFNSIGKVLQNANVSALGNGKTVSGMKTITLRKWFGLGSLFHPMSNLLQKKINDKVTARDVKKQSEKEAKEQAVRDEEKVKTQAVDAKGEAAAAKVKENVDKQKGGAGKLIPVVGAVVVAACVVHLTASDIPKVDWYKNVAPTVIQATSLAAQGQQVMSGGPDVSMEQIGTTLSSLTDKEGNTIWQSAGMTALSGEKVAKDSEGNIQDDINPEYKQAYGEHSTAAIFDKAAITVLNALTGPGAAVNAGLVLCDGTFQLVAAAVGIAAQITAAAVSGGTSQAVVTAVQAGESLAFQHFVIGSAIKWVQNLFIDGSTSGGIPDEDLLGGGVQRGNLTAYGIRAAANQAAMTSGGVSLNNQNSTFVSQADREDEQQFRSQNMFAKMFDVNDYRSLSGRLADSVSPSMYNNAATLMGSVSNPLKSIGSLFSSFVPKASAAASNSWSGDYNWGFPQYGIPEDMLTDPDLADPYGNANTVTDYLNQNCASGDTIGPDEGACDGDKGITNRIKQCFGNDLTYDSSQKIWDVVPVSNNDGINVNDSLYTDQACGDTSNRDWRRIIMFIQDTSTMKAISCYTGDDAQSCTDVGVTSQAQADNPTGGSTTGTTGTPVTPSGTAAEIATKLIALVNNRTIRIEQSGVLTDLEAARDGKTINCSGEVSSLDPRILEVMLQLSVKYDMRVSTIDTNHICDGGGHPGGRAFDVGQVVDRATGESSELNDAATNSVDHDFLTYIVSILPPGSYVAQVQCQGRKDVVIPADIHVYTKDGCNHQHIEVGPAS